jgi:hypothetical protein
MEIAGHVSPQMLSRYSHIRTEAERKAPDEVDRQCAAAREHRKQAGQQLTSDAQSPAVQPLLQ